MSEWDPYIVAVVLVAIWIVGLLYLRRRNLLEKYGLQLQGPILLWKTQRGRDLIDRIARRKRFWRFFGDLSIVMVGLTMAAMTFLLVWEATLVTAAAVRANPPSPNEFLGLPVINPFIPLGYGLLGLVVAVVLHEFSHGILSRASGIKIRSLGILFLVLPAGAFVEPDEDEMRAMPRRERARLYAAGPATNLLLALLFAFLFSSVMFTSVAPIHDGVGVVGFAGSSSPSERAGMKPYTIITSLNGTEIHSYGEFVTVLGGLKPNETVPVVTYDGTNYAPLSVTLGRNPDTGGAYMGIYAFDVSTDVYHPLTNPDRFGGVLGALVSYLSLPFQGRSPVEDPAVRFYRVQGPMAALPVPFFWILTNSFYWLFWLNFALGTTNALPAVPLDGGYIFKDALEGLVTRLRRGIRAEDRDRVVTPLVALSAVLILGLILWLIIGPRI